jgi:hypothetical protein
LQHLPQKFQRVSPALNKLSGMAGGLWIQQNCAVICLQCEMLIELEVRIECQKGSILIQARTTMKVSALQP